MKIGIVIVDMINDFVAGVLKFERASRIIPNIKRLLDFARKKSIPVIYVNDAHLPNTDKEFEIWPVHAVVGTKGAEIIDELKPEKNDYVIRKRRYSAFFETSLDSILRELHMDTLVLAGLATNICIQHTAADAFFRGYTIIIPEDCVEAPTLEAKRSAVEYMRKFYGANITNVDKLMEELMKKE